MGESLSSAAITIRGAKHILRDEDTVVFAAAVVAVAVGVSFLAVEPHVVFACGAVVGAFLVGKILVGEPLRFSRLTLPSFFMMVYLSALALPSLLVFADMVHPIRTTYLAAVQSVLLTFPIGVGLANLVYSVPSAASLFRIPKVQLQENRVDRMFRAIYLAFLVFSIPIVLLFFFYMPAIPLIEVFQSNPMGIDPVALRFAENELPKGIHYLYEMLRRLILPFCVLYAYFTAHTADPRRKPVSLLLFLLLFLGTLLISALTLDRAPPIAMCIMLILGHLLIRNRSVFAIMTSWLVLVLVIALVIGGMISVVQYQSDFPLDLVPSTSAYVLYYRLLYSPALMASRSFEAYNSQSEFLHGQSVRLFSIVTGGEYVESLGEDSLVVAPVTFVGDLWRQWGWSGVIVGTVALGFVFQLIQATLISGRPRSVPRLIVTVILLVGAVWIIYGNAFGVTTVSVLVFGTWLGFLARGRSKSSEVKQNLTLRTRAPAASQELP